MPNVFMKEPTHTNNPKDRDSSDGKDEHALQTAV